MVNQPSQELLGYVNTPQCGNREPHSGEPTVQTQNTFKRRKNSEKVLLEVQNTGMQLREGGDGGFLFGFWFQ